MNVTCECGRATYDDDHYTTCYTCFVDRRSEYATCVWCGRWHNPKFATCFQCRIIPGRDEAGRDLRLMVLARDHFECRYCHESGVFLNVDHIKPCASGGTPDPWNLQTLCAGCNRTKGATWWAGCHHDKIRQQVMEAYYTYLWIYLTPDEQARLDAEMRDLMQIDQPGEILIHRGPLTNGQISRLITFEQQRHGAQA